VQHASVQHASVQDKSPDMSHSFTVLPDRAVYDISGDDAKPFLQGLVTSDVEQLADGEAAHAGLLTPQGKIMFDFFVVGKPDGYVIDCAASQIDEIIKRLTFYKLRAKVDIVAKPELAVAAVWDEDVSTELLQFNDPRLTGMGQRVIGDPAALTALSNATADDYLLHRITLGIADTADIGSSKTFPHEANFDQLGGVSFTKGCFVGQEVVSRMQHRGTARSRIIPVSFEGEFSEANAEIRAGSKKIGQMLSTVRGHGLALVRLDRAKSATEAGDVIEADGKALTLIKPDWATFDM